jgi:threonine aldolase
VTIAVPPAVYSVFPQVPAPAIRPLQDWSFFWEWDLETSLVRWMTSFATTDADLDRFATGVRHIVQQHH